MDGILIEDEINVKQGSIEIVNAPKIIQQACDQNSILYSQEGVELRNCEWDEYGKTIKIDTTQTSICRININSGYAEGAIYKIYVNEFDGVILKGDANGDNKVDFEDMLQINKHRLGKVQLIGIYLEAAEVTGDGEVTFEDILKINKYRLGKINSL